MSQQPDDVDEGGDGEKPLYTTKFPETRLADPTDPNSDYELLKFDATLRRPIAAQRCHRIRPDGTRCKRWAYVGAKHCPNHAKVESAVNNRTYREAVIDQARMEMLRFVPKALMRLEELLDDETAPHAVRLKAVTETLDRVGIRGGTEVTLTDDRAEDPAEILRGKIDKLVERAAESDRTAISAASSTNDTDTETETDFWKPRPRVIRGEVVPAPEPEPEPELQPEPPPLPPPLPSDD